MSGTTDRKVTITLTVRQAKQLDAVRGRLRRDTAVARAVGAWLDKEFPVGETLEETVALQTARIFQKGIRGGYPVPMADHPSVEEMTWVQVPFPPPAEDRSASMPARSRAFIHRGIWATAMEDCGWSWDEIAVALGYSDSRTARGATDMWVARYAEQAAPKRRSESRVKLERIESYVWDTIRNPPFRFTVKGDLAINPDGTAAIDVEALQRSLKLAAELVEAHARVDGSNMRDSVRNDAEVESFRARILEVVEMLRREALTGAPAAIEGSLVNDDAEAPEEEAAGDADSPPVPWSDDRGDDGRDEEQDERDDLEETGDPADGD